VEGVNMPAFMAGYLAVMVLVATSLVALGLLIFRHGRAARLVFASGLLGAAVISAGAVLSFFMPELRHGVSALMILASAASLLLAGTGQFIAAFRGVATFAVAFVCAAVAMLLVASPLLLGDWDVRLLGDLGFKLAELGLPTLALASLVPAVLSVVIAILAPLAFTARSTERQEA
jgi:hypothetical protein